MIRIRQTDDYELIARLDKECFKDDAYKLTDKQMTKCTWWVAEEVYAGEEPEAVGYIGMKATWKGGYITRTGVVEQARGIGLQRRLTRAVIRHVRKEALQRVWTYVLSTNISSLRNLIACGLKPYTTKVRGPGTYIYLDRLT
jgi:ribosomal protein S18 acetylase RimI-like enzyme